MSVHPDRGRLWRVERPPRRVEHPPPPAGGPPPPPPPPPPPGQAPAGARGAPVANRFDTPAAYSWVKRQLAYGPRPAGSRQLRKLAATLRKALPNGRYETVSPGLRNVVGTVPGRDPSSYVVLGAHYDTK